MDQGDATVWAGVIAAVAALGGAVVGARLQRRQIKDQAATEHGHWIRERRMEAYVDYLREWDQAVRHLRQQWTLVDELIEAEPDGDLLEDPAQEIADRAFNSVQPATEAVEPFLDQVTMLGPPQAEDAALKMTMALQQMAAETENRLIWATRRQTENRGWEPWHNAESPGQGHRQEFIACVRQILGAPPTPGAARRPPLPNPNV